MAAARKTTKKKTPTKKKTSKSKSSTASARKTSKTKKKTTTKSAAAGRKTSTKKKKTVEKAAKVKKTTTKSRAKKTTKSAAASDAPKTEKKATPKPKAPKKPAFDAEFLKEVRDSLVDERRSLMSMMQSTQEQLAGRDTGLADLSDIASGGFEDELALGLMANEAATLEKIDAAIQRIDDGTYGICLDCEKPIPKKRLEFLPFAQRCMECEGHRERRVRMGTIND